MKLVIVESPTKARKLSGYLGKGFEVESSVGHVRDLPRKKLSVDEKTFEPMYEVSEDKEKVVSQLKRLAKKSDEIYLAMDPDREGEAIAWHLKFLLKGTDSKFKRATFHEITKSAVLKAIEHPSRLNMDLVNAQQARRVLDRLVGYKLSPVLWKKVRRGLSAGRVQSVALRLIVEKEKEIQAFKADEYWELDTLLSVDAKKIKTPKPKDAESPAWLKDNPENTLVARVFEVSAKKYDPKQEADVTPVLDLLKSADYKIASVEKKARKRSSLPPFTTSTLQQTAANRLSMTSRQTMRFAQQLYEEGLITYHRTDSVNLSEQATTIAREYIAAEYGQDYLPVEARIFKKKSKSAQEAHEAIRVTDLKKSAADLKQVSKKFTDRHAKLYDLIWRRFLASQMQEAVYDQTTVIISADDKKAKVKNAKLKTTGSVLKFDGWMKLFPNAGDRILPEVAEGQTLHYQDLFAAQKFTQPPARYNDASLVKELESKGIGRPSTYASIISVIVDRGYVERQDRRFIPTAVGITVSDFLVKHFKDIMDYDFTAEMEDDLDVIAHGKKEWKAVLKAFYTPFIKSVEKVTDSAKRAEIPVEKTGESCPECGKAEKGEVVIRTGRFGKFKSCSRFPDCKFTENIVHRVEGQHCPLCQKGDIIIKNTRWGKPFYGCSLYPDCDWASWKQPEKGLKISKAEWKKMQAEREKRKKARAKNSKKKSSK